MEKLAWSLVSPLYSTRQVIWWVDRENKRTRANQNFPAPTGIWCGVEKEMSKIYFGFALASSMFEGDGNVSFKQVSPEEAREIIKNATEEGQLESCLNPSHLPTIDAMRSRYGINVQVPEKAPFAKLQAGDSLVVMGVRGLPRLEGRHEYSKEEIASATFSFSVFTRTG